MENAQPRKRKLDEASTAESAAKKSATSSASAITPPTIQPKSQSPILNATPLTPVQISRSLAVDESLSLQRHRHCKYLGHTAALDAALFGLGSLNHRDETAWRKGTIRQVAENEYFSIHADADVPIPDDEIPALEEIHAIVGQHGPALVDIYFRNVHPSYPIIQKTIFLERHRPGDGRFNPPLLAAIYLLALGWWDCDTILSRFPKPDVRRLEYIALAGLTVAMQRPKISAVQAGLLLLQRSKSSTWTLTVQLVALAQEIGLHLDCSHWSIPLWERRLRKRLAWALFMQDKWSALVHGRPSHIHAADWSVPPPSPEDFSENTSTAEDSRKEEEEPAEETLQPSTTAHQGRLLFTQFLGLTHIMSHVCNTFYTSTSQREIIAASPFLAPQEILHRAKPVQLALKTWFSQLPPECKMDVGTPADHLSSVGSLHLAYYATEISIHRLIVSSLAASPSPDPYMLHITRSAAKTRLISAMDFLNRLRPQHLESFWFFPSAANFSLIGTFGALLMVTSPGVEERQFYRARLGELRWTLGVSASRVDWMGGVVDGLEAAWGMVGRVGARDRVELQGVRGKDVFSQAAAGAIVGRVQVDAYGADLERDDRGMMYD